jgi:YidC/Oxa1 family membrane protein insertase
MDNRRLILLLIFGFSLLMLWENWQKHVAPKPQAAATAAQPAGAPSSSSAAVPTPSATPGATPQVPVAAAAQPAGPRVRVRTDRYIAEIAAPGGDIVHLELLDHRAAEDKTRNLVLFDEKHRYAAQSGLIGPGLPSHKSAWQIPAGDLELKDGQNEVRLTMTAVAEGNVKIAKTLVFHRGNHVIDTEYSIANQGGAELVPHAYFQLVRDDKAPDGSSAMMSTFTGPAFYSDAEKFQKLEFADIEKGKAKHVGKTDNGWVGIVQHYFVAAWLPQGKSEREFYTRKLDAGFVAAGVIVPTGVVAPGQTATVKVPLYAGPQIQEQLSKLAPGLDLVVDYGWLHVIAAPLFWVLETIHKLVGNWGWAIILLTVLIKAVFYPLSAASYKSMAKMRVLTPKLMKLKETYADDRQRMNTEMMELYKREKVNPFGGCLPILVQIPVFIALYWVLLGTVEMRGAPWLGWITDLSEKDPYYIMPLIMGVTMIVQTKLNPTPPDPIQAKVMMIMPVVFTGMFVMFPAGLVLYWTVNNILSIAQQWQINRMIEAAGLKAH